MGYLKSEDQQLILDFYFRCGDEEDISPGRDLIASNPEAARLYANLEDTLTELDTLKYEPCPENLAELTVARLKLAASARLVGTSKLETLLKQEQDNLDYHPAPVPALSAGVRFWRPAFEVLATAAAVVLVAGILFPSFGAMRDRSRQVVCADHLRQIGQAMAAFGSDHNGRIGETLVKSGSPWWKIGYQGPEIHSNTRYVWQLVKDGYAKGSVFVCGGDSEGIPVQYNAAQMAELEDFPLRRNISYSFILLCDDNANSLTRQSRRIIAGDLNPLFRQVPFQPSVYHQLNEFERIQLDEQLRQMMSANHRHKGQSVLYSDGSVEFITTRIVNGDDIFTVLGVDVYRGMETPCNPDDIFLVP